MSFIFRSMPQNHYRLFSMSLILMVDQSTPMNDDPNDAQLKCLVGGGVAIVQLFPFYKLGLVSCLKDISIFCQWLKMSNQTSIIKVYIMCIVQTFISAYIVHFTFSVSLV